MFSCHSSSDNHHHGKASAHPADAKKFKPPKSSWKAPPESAKSQSTPAHFTTTLGKAKTKPGPIRTN
jgi:hypothetical protein